MDLHENVTFEPTMAKQGSMKTASQLRVSASVSRLHHQRSQSQMKQALQQHAQAKRDHLNVLLLGTGACGKSTIMKQMKILYRDGFSKDETAEGVLLCRSNLLSTIHTLVNWCLTTGHHFDKAETRKELQDHEKIIMEHTDDGPPEIGEIIAKMWEHSVGIKEAFRQLTVEGTTLMDSAKYFLDKAEDVFKADFVPTHEDILFTRKVTKGLHLTKFAMDGNKVHMIDVGGQRGERSKWMAAFDHCTAIMFVAAISDYNLRPEEEMEEVLDAGRRSSARNSKSSNKSKTRLDESLDVFEAIANLSFFKEVPIFLFLNKMDLFEEKIARIDMSIYSPGYKGGFDAKAAVKYIKSRFSRRTKNRNAELYIHTTTAINTQSVEFVWKAARDVLLEDKLGKF